MRWFGVMFIVLFFLGMVGVFFVDGSEIWRVVVGLVTVGDWVCYVWLFLLGA